MAKKRYKFNPQTLTYEVIAIPLRIRFYRILRKILVGFILASIANLLFSFFFYTPKMYRISERNNELMLQYEMLGDKIRAATAKLDELRHRDNRVYRSLFGVDSLSVHGVYTPYPAAKYGSMKDDPYAPQMIGTWLELDRMTRLLYQESKSLDQLEVMAKSKELMADAIPAIWPIDRRNLRGHIGAFGSRVHPISGRISGHQGIDLGGRTGNPVYATGDGTVAFNNEGVRGYGLQVLIDHGFGYKTRYAHLSKILVSPGQKVKRGELIGIVNAKSSGQNAEGLGFAIPVNTAIQVAEELINNGYVTGRPAMGVTVLSINDAQTAFQYGVNQAGVYVQSVNEGGAADKAGLQPGDRFVSIDGTAVNSTSDITGIIGEHAVGDTIEVQVVRGTQIVTANVTLEESTPQASSTQRTEG